LCDPHQQFQNPNDDDDDEDDVSLGLSAGELLLLLARRAGAAGAALVQHLQWMSRSLSKLSFFGSCDWGRQNSHFSPSTLL